jgi:drug/metabolite transporter (DMT)-like permease
VGTAWVLLAAVGFATLGPLARAASDAGVSALTFSLWRSAVAVGILVVFLAFLARSGQTTLTRWRDVPRMERLQLAVMGPFIAGSSVFLFFAFERMSIALVLIIYYSYPSFVALAATRVHAERLTWDRIVAIILSTSGLALVVLTPQLEVGAPELDGFAVACALVAACCQAGYALVAANGFRSVPAFQAATLIRGAALIVAMVLIVPFMAVVGDLADLVDRLRAPEAWGSILVAGSVGAALPAVALVIGYRRVGSVRGAILMIFEPVVGVALAAVILGERPAPVQLLGGLLVLAGAALATIVPRASVAARTVDPSPSPAE